MHRIDAVALFALLAIATGSLVAGEVYSWKDANGVTHYSQTPPPAGTRFEVRGIRDSGATQAPEAAQAAAVAAPEPGQSSHCDVARGNITALEGEGPVQQVAADGTPTELDAQARSSQLELARAAVRAYCR